MKAADFDATLTEFAALPTNWDSYGGKATAPEAIEQMRAVLRLLETAGLLVRVHLAPCGYGGCQVESIPGNWEIECDGAEINYVVRAGSNSWFERWTPSAETAVTAIADWAAAANPEPPTGAR